MSDGNDLLMGSGGKGAKFETMGDTVVGTVADTPKKQQMKKWKSTELDFWPSGDPKMQVIVTLQTDQRDPGNPQDDGKRVLFIPPRMQAPVREAVQRANAKGLQIGGRLAVRWVSGAGQVEGDPKVYAAEYAPPTVEVGGLINGGQTATTTPAPEPAPAAAPAAGSMLSAPPVSQQDPPAGVDPALWAGLPDAQRQAILAAVGQQQYAF
jgi:hypothetical protein